MIADTKRLLYYFRPSPDRKRLLFGGRARYLRHDPIAGALLLWRKLTTVFPQLAEVKLSHGWWGYVAYLRGGVPDMGESQPETLPGVYHALGCHGSGVVMMSWLDLPDRFACFGSDKQPERFSEGGMTPFPNSTVTNPGFCRRLVPTISFVIGWIANGTVFFPNEARLTCCHTGLVFGGHRLQSFGAISEDLRWTSQPCPPGQIHGRRNILTSKAVALFLISMVSCAVKDCRWTSLRKSAVAVCGIPLSSANVDIWGRDIEGNKWVFETGDSDGRCEWTGRGPLVMPWSDRGAAMVPLVLQNDDQTPFDGDARNALTAVLNRFATLGLRPVPAFELEFYLADPKAVDGALSNPADRSVGDPRGAVA